MSKTPEDNAVLDSILSKTKAQYEPGPMRNRLYETIEFNGVKPRRPRFEWMYYAGMGDVGLLKVSEPETKAVKELLAQGRLVPTFEEDFYGIQKIRHIQHFDDVKFGLDAQDNILIYDFARRIDIPDMPDPVIRPDGIHDAAIKQIKDRMDFSVASHTVTVDNAPIQLKGGPVVRPIITDARLIELKKRQQEFALKI